MKTVKGKVAAVTGAGSGIGRALAVLLADHGCDLAVSDVNQQGLAETAEQCRAKGVRVHQAVVDVGDRARVHAWADEVVQALGAVHIIVNNAGVALAATVEDMDYADFEWLMQINFWGVVHGTKAFLPHLRAAGEGHVVNLSSLFGLVAIPTQAAYNAAKFAVRGFTDSLRQELEIEGSAIGVTCVHPGGVKTNIARAARYTEKAGFIDQNSATEFERLFATTPERAAQDIFDAIVKNRRRQLVGKDALFVDLVQRRWPDLFHWVLVKGAQRRRAKMIKAPASQG